MKILSYNPIYEETEADCPQTSGEAITGVELSYTWFHGTWKKKCTGAAKLDYTQRLSCLRNVSSLYNGKQVWRLVNVPLGRIGRHGLDAVTQYVPISRIQLYETI